MNNPLWRIAELLALALPRAEREAVLGDLLESGHSALRALSDMLRFVLRRSATRIGFPLLILPLALLLTILARDTADGVAIYLWLWMSNLDAYLLGSAGFWHGIAECAPRLLLACLSLSLWSWSSAVLASRLSRFTALLFCAILVLTAPIGPPADLMASRARDFHGNDAVFHGAFYRFAFPCLVQCLFVLLPALAAIRQPRTENAP
jgi:hypothetical protein